MNWKRMANKKSMLTTQLEEVHNLLKQAIDSKAAEISALKGQKNERY